MKAGHSSLGPAHIVETTAPSRRSATPAATFRTAGGSCPGIFAAGADSDRRGSRGMVRTVTKRSQ